MFWWEIVEMLRKLLLVGIMVVVASGTTLQIVLGTLFAAIFMLFQVQASPYKEMSE